MSANEIVTNVVINASTSGIAKTTRELEALASISSKIPSKLRTPLLDNAPLKSIDAYQRAMMAVNEVILTNTTNAATAKQAIASVFKSSGNAKFAKSILTANKGWKDTVASSDDVLANVKNSTEFLEILKTHLAEAGVKGSRLASMLQLAKASYATLAGEKASYAKAEKFASAGGGNKLVTSAQRGIGSANRSIDRNADAQEVKAKSDATERLKMLNRMQAKAIDDAAKAERRQAREAQAAAKAQLQLARALASTAKAAATQTKNTEKLNKALNKQNGITAITTGGFFRLRAVLSALVLGFAMLGSAITEWFKLASEYAETNHLLYATLYNDYKNLAGSEQTVLTATDLFGNKIQSTTTMSVEAADAIEGIVDKLNSMSRALMVDPTNLKRTYATFYEMANSANMARENVDELATGMTRLTYDIGSLWDEDFESVAKKMRSALGGITTAVRLFGIDISRTAADTWLASHNIDATYNSLNRANKMIVIYNMLLEGTSTAQNDLAASAAQPANMLRILSEQAQYAARSLGAALFPLLTPLIAVFIKLAQAIQVAANTLASFLSSIFGGWYNSASKGWNSFLSNLGQTKGASSGLEEIADDMEDVSSGAGGAADAAKELKKQLLGFDEINNITPEAPTSGGGGGGGGISAGGVDLEIPMASIGDMIGNVEGMISKFLEDAVPNLLRVAANAAWGFVQGFIAGFGLIPSIIANILSFIDQLVGAIRKIFGATEEDGVVTHVFDDIVTSVGKAVGAVVGFSVSLGLISKIGGILSSIGGAILKVFDPLKGLIGDVIGWIGKLAGSFALAEGPGMTLVGRVFGGLLGVIKTVFSPIQLVVGALVLLAGAFKYVYDNSESFREFVGETVNVLFATFREIGESVAPAIELVKAAFDDVGEAFANLASNESFISLLQGILEGVLNVIIFVVSGVAELVGGIITVGSYVIAFFAEIFAGVVDFVSDVITVLSPIGDLIYFIFVELPGIVLEALGEFFTVVGEIFASIFGVTQAYADEGEGVVSESTTTISDIINGFVEFIGGIFDRIGGFVDNVIGAFTTLQTFVDLIFSAIKMIINGKTEEGINLLRNVVFGVIDIFREPFESAKQIVSDAIEAIKGFLNTTLTFPSFKVPHFHIDGGVLPWGIGGQGRKPDISVEWYAKGGIATDASLIGVGEAGDEGIIPLQGARMKPFAMAISDNINRYGVGKTTQTDRDILEATIVQSNLIREQNQLLREILNKDTSVNLDGKAIINSINRQQRVQGRQLIGV